jgi:ribosomal protection tetracycline resistance protein
VLRRMLNLGIVAHVDAGKTTLTERLLYEAGVITEIGSVDNGTTRTDTLALERQRGITIKAAVVAFAIDDLVVNLIDTPGHPDFIAEVERVLCVLDGAVLVVSAVEGVQAQTRILWRALERLGVPALIFVNKTDRPGASADRVLGEIRRTLTARAVAMDAEARELAAIDAALLSDAVPVFSGSALRGDGVAELKQGIAELLPAAAGDAGGPLAATVFKIERGVPYVRMFSGTLRARDRIGDEKVTEIRVFEDGADVPRPSAAAGVIAKLGGIRALRIGDVVGEGRTMRPQFPPPTLESVVVPANPDDGRRLRVALEELSRQDPLIAVRQDGQQLSISLYGEVQKEVVEATLATEYGLCVAFHETTPLYVERPEGVGEALEVLGAESNPYEAEIGLRIEPGADEFRLRIDPRTAPLYVYKTIEGFEERMGEYVRGALREGRFGWQVVDCLVTMTRCGYAVPDGPPSKQGRSKAVDFRKLAPLVVAQALEAAGTVVCEPTLRVRVEFPAPALGAVLAALGRLGAAVETPSLRGGLAVVEGVLSAVHERELQRRLAGLTHGEGVLESTFEGYRPVVGEPPPSRHDLVRARS